MLFWLPKLWPTNIQTCTITSITIFTYIAMCDDNLHLFNSLCEDENLCHYLVSIIHFLGSLISILVLTHTSDWPYHIGIIGYIFANILCITPTCTSLLIIHTAHVIFLLEGRMNDTIILMTVCWWLHTSGIITVGALKLHTRITPMVLQMYEIDFHCLSAQFKMFYTLQTCIAIKCTVWYYTKFEIA